MAQAPALAFLDRKLRTHSTRPRPDATHWGQRTAAPVQAGLVCEVFSLDFGFESGRSLYQDLQLRRIQSRHVQYKLPQPQFTTNEREIATKTVAGSPQVFPIHAKLIWKNSYSSATKVLSKNVHCYQVSFVSAPSFSIKILLSRLRANAAQSSANCDSPTNRRADTFTRFRSTSNLIKCNGKK